MNRYELHIYASVARERLLAAGRACLAHPWLSACAVFAVAGMGAAVLAVKTVTVQADAPVLLRAGSEGSVDVTIPSGTSARGAAQLVAEKLETTPEAILTAIRLSGAAIQAGRYRFGNSETLKSIVEKLTTGDVVQGTLRHANLAAEKRFGRQPRPQVRHEGHERSGASRGDRRGRKVA